MPEGQGKQAEILGHGPEAAPAVVEMLRAGGPASDAGPRPGRARGGGADDVSRQALTLARGYAEAAGGPLEAVLIGADAAAAAAGLGELGVATAHVAVHDGLAALRPAGLGQDRSPSWSSGSPRPP